MGGRNDRIDFEMGDQIKRTSVVSKEKQVVNF